MSTRSKEKVVAAFRKLFRSSEKLAEQEGASDSSTNSPSRRLLGRHHHRPDAVTPSDSSMPENPGTSHTAHGSCFFKTKKSSSTSSQVLHLIFELLPINLITEQRIFVRLSFT